LVSGPDGGNDYVFTYTPDSSGHGTMVQNGESSPVVQGNITN